MQVKQQTQNHLLFIDGLRALAAIFVVMHHGVLQYYDVAASGLNSFSAFGLTKLEKLIIVPFFQGHYAVDLFIVLSGYSLMLSIIKNDYALKGGTLTFFKRRIIRILPPYYAAIGVSILLIWLLIGTKTGTHWDVSLPVNYSDVVTHILLIHDIFTSSFSHINHSLWSIAVEFRIYLFFPLLVWLWSKKGPLTAIGTSVLVSIVGLFILMYAKRTNPDVDLEYPGVSPYIILFALGMLAADLSFSEKQNFIQFRNRYASLPAILVSCGALIFLVAIAYIKHVFKYNAPGSIHMQDKAIDMMVGLLSAFALFAFSIAQQGKFTYSLVKIFSWRPLAFIGTFSYSLYLIHPPLLQVITQYVMPLFHVSRYVNCMLLLSAGTLLIIPVSYLFFYLFEKPFLRAGKKRPATNEKIDTTIRPVSQLI